MSRRYAAFFDAPDHMTKQDVQAMLANELPRLFGGAPDLGLYDDVQDIVTDLDDGTETLGARPTWTRATS